MRGGILMKKRGISLLIAVTMIFSLLPVMCVNAATIDKWSVYFSNVAEGSDAVLKLDTSEAASGSTSVFASFDVAKKSMYYISLAQRVPVEKGKTYVYGVKVKAEKAHNIQLKINQINNDSLVPFSESNEWQEYRFTYVHKLDDESVNYAIIVEGLTKGVWFDDAYFYDAEDSKKTNLIANSGFEGAAAAAEETVVESTVGAAEAQFNALKKKDSFTYEEIAAVMGGYQYSAVYPAHDITVDGSGSDWADYVSMMMPVRSDQYYVLNKAWILGEMDTTAEYKFCYDKENLYVYIEVNDDKHVYIDNGDDYWKGDSIQLAVCPVGKTYATEISLVHNEEEKKSSVYSSANTEEEVAKVKLATSRTEEKTIYEAAIPWDITFTAEDIWTWSGEGYQVEEADKLNEDGLPETCLLSFLINENDGAGRAYMVQVDAGGIGQVGKYPKKSSKPFPLLELLSEDKDWYAWIEGEEEISTGEEAIFDVYLVNRGEARTVTIEIPFFDSKETVTIPANSGIRREFKHISEVYGEKTVECIVTEGGNKGTSTFTFYANPGEGYFDEDIKALRYKGKELSNLLKRCKEAGIEPDYEIARAAIFNQYIDWFEDDLAHGEIKKSEYTIQCLEDIYNKTKPKLLAYLNGSEKPLEVPKYVTSETHYDGIRTSALAELGGEVAERDMFFIGFNAWGADVHFPFISKIGFNFSQEEAGPTWITQTKTVDAKHWNAVSNTSVGVPEHTLEITNEEKVSGESSMKLTYKDAWKNNLYRKLYQAIPCKPNTTYKWGFKAKANNAHTIHASITNGNPYNERAVLPEGTYDWTNFDYEHTTGDNTSHLSFSFFFMAQTDAFYLDDLYVYEKGKEGENLLDNGGFEERWSEDQYVQHDYLGTYGILDRLEKCRELNISADFLISPHYFHSVFYQQYPEMSHPVGIMVKYRYDNPIAREVVSEYLEILMEQILPYKDVIGSITLANEPSHIAHQSGDYYRPHLAAYLERIYNGDIAEMNRIYGTDYKTFDEVPFTAGTKPSPQLYDYINFNDEIGTDFIKFLYDEVKKYTDIPVNTKVMHWVASTDIGSANKRWLLGAGADPEKLVPYSDINGNDSELSITTPFEQNLAGKQLQKSINYDFNRSLLDAPVFNGEDHIGLNGEEYYGSDWAKSVRIEQWMSPFHGRSMTTIWNFDRTRSRTWTAAGIAFRPDALEAVSTAAMDINRLAEYVYEVAEKPADVGILFSKTARLMNYDHMNSVYKTYENLLYNGIKPMFAAESQPELIHKYDTLYLAACRHIELSTLLELKKYVDNGGRLILLGEDQLSLDGRHQPHPQELVEYVKSKAEIYPWMTDGTDVTMPDNEIYNIMDKTTADKQRIKLIDAETGEKVRGVEWQGVDFENINGESGTVINIGNYNWNENKTVQLYIDGELVENPFEMRSNKTLDSAFTVESSSAIFIKVVKK